MLVVVVVFSAVVVGLVVIVVVVVAAEFVDNSERITFSISDFTTSAVLR